MPLKDVETKAEEAGSYLDKELHTGWADPYWRGFMTGTIVTLLVCAALYVAS